MCFSYQKFEMAIFANDIPCYKKAYRKVLTLAFAEDIVIKKFKSLEVFRDKGRCFFLFTFKNDHLFYERLLNSKIFHSHLTKNGSVISVS